MIPFKQYFISFLGRKVPLLRRETIQGKQEAEAVEESQQFDGMLIIKFINEPHH
jgi:hypothetical protein